nr:MAG TPA: hypothetical protein [Caudoviricetes sp.]
MSSRSLPTKTKQLLKYQPLRHEADISIIPRLRQKIKQEEQNAY